MLAVVTSLMLIWLSKVFEGKSKFFRDELIEATSLAWTALRI